MTKFTVLETAYHEEEIKRSRFRAVAAPCTNVAEVEQFFAQHQVLDATHNCYAWRIGQTYRFNDDGEPSGTAGRPILQAIDGLNLDQVAVLVIRWYGGIKLGAGGLVRAYGGSAARCLQSCDTQEIIEYVSLKFKIPFEYLGVWHQALSLYQAHTESENYEGDGLLARIHIPKVKEEDLLAYLRDASSANISQH